MNHDARSPPPHTALKDYLAALQISSLSSAAAMMDEQDDDPNNKNIEAVSSSQTGKIPFILVDDNMKATPSFLLASTTPPKTSGRHRPLNRTNSLPTRVSGTQPPRKSTAAPRKKSHSSGLLDVDDKKRTIIMEKSRSSSLVQLLHPIQGKEKQDLLQHDDDETTSKIWCRWNDFTTHGYYHHDVLDKNSKNDDDNRSTTGGSTTRRAKLLRRQSHDQGVPLPTRTVEEHDA